MKVVFGYNVFKPQEFQPGEHGLNEERFGGVKVVVRQRYFHLFWIPVFPLDKIWTFEKNGEEISLGSKLEYAAKASSIQPRTPWYSFLLPILIVTGILGFWVLNEADSLTSNYRYQKEKELELQEMQKNLSLISTKNDIEVIDKEHGYDATPDFLKVEERTAEFTIVTQFSTGNNPENEVSIDRLDYYNKNKHSLKTYKIPNKQFELHMSNGIYPYFINLLGDGKTYELIKIREDFGTYE